MSAVAGGSSEGGPSVNRALTLAERVGSGALPVLGGATGRSTRDEMAATGGPRGPVGFSSVLSAVPESYFDRRHQFYVEAALKREATRNERIANRTRLMESDPVNPMYPEPPPPATQPCRTITVPRRNHHHYTPQCCYNQRSLLRSFRASISMLRMLSQRL